MALSVLDEAGSLQVHLHALYQRLKRLYDIPSMVRNGAPVQELYTAAFRSRHGKGILFNVLFDIGGLYPGEADSRTMVGAYLAFKVQLKRDPTNLRLQHRLERMDAELKKYFDELEGPPPPEAYLRAPRRRRIQYGSEGED